MGFQTVDAKNESGEGPRSPSSSASVAAEGGDESETREPVRERVRHLHRGVKSPVEDDVLLPQRGGAWSTVTAGVAELILDDSQLGDSQRSG